MHRLQTLIILSLLPLALSAQGWPAQYGGVMLQGFYWDSYADTQWTNLQSEADELSPYFNLIWVPNSAYCGTTTTQMGYAPVYWYKHLSSFGSEAELRAMIQAYRSRGTGIIEDVVINHRNGVSSWTDFPAEQQGGKTWQLTSADICSDDECVKNGYAATGAKDTGEGWDGMRDLDHTSANVQQNVVNYLRFLHDDLGYAGYRYDFVKGYAPRYTGLYNSTVGATYSVGEYWDGNLSLVTNWIENTRTDGNIQSAAFDFPLKYNLNTCCNASANWNKLASASLAGDNTYRRWAVTFVDNHDSYRGSDKVSSNALAANAFILAMPGTPCVFLPHWQLYRQDIKQLILARRLAGITNQSTTKTLDSSHSDRYALRVDGTDSHSLVIVMGAGSYTPSADYAPVASGTNYALYLSRNIESPWISLPSGSYDGTQQVTLTALSTSDSPVLVYSTDGSEPSASNGTQVSSGTNVTVASSATLKVGLLNGTSVQNIQTRQYTITNFTPTTATVYVRADWPTLYFYAWDATSTLLASWPGTRITDTASIGGQTWYCHTFPVSTSTYKFNIIFDKGSSADQTVDIDGISSDRFYVLSTSKNADGKYTVTDVTGTYTAIHTPAATQTSATQHIVNVLRTDGTLVRRASLGTSDQDALRGLPRGLYLVNGKKVMTH
jgi:alpha-amylase